MVVVVPSVEFFMLSVRLALCSGLAFQHPAVIRVFEGM